MLTRRPSPHDVRENSGPRTILFVHDGENWIRGSERCMLDLIAQLDRQRFQPVVLCDAPKLRAAAESAGATTYLSRGWHEAGDRLLPTKAAVREIADVIDRHTVGLVHCNSALPIKAVLGAALPRRVPTVAHLHIVHPHITRLYTGLHQVSVAVGVSEAAIAGLREDGMPADRIRVIYNGVDEVRIGGGDRRGLRAELGIPAGAVTATALGSLIPRKGVDVLLDALARLRHATPTVHLLLAGDGAQRAVLERQAAALQVADQVHFLGEVVDAGAVLRDATDIVVSAAREEAFPLNLLEAAYCELPIVASDIPPHRESLVAGVTGRLVPVDDAGEFADAIARLAADDDVRRTMGQAGASRVRERFLLRHYVAGFESLYAELMTFPRARYGWLGNAHWPPAYTRWLRAKATRTARGGHGGR